MLGLTNPQVLRLAPLVALQHAAREFVEDRKQGEVEASIPHVARIVQFLAEHPSRRPLALRGDLKQEAIRPGRQRAAELEEHVCRARVVREHVRLIDQGEG